VCEDQGGGVDEDVDVDVPIEIFQGGPKLRSGRRDRRETRSLSSSRAEVRCVGGGLSEVRGERRNDCLNPGYLRNQDGTI
jgi:hypothetical protein